MPRKTTTLAGGLYRLEPEYNRSNNGIWHAVEIANTSSVRDVGQAERLDADRPLAAKWRPLPVAVERVRRMGEFWELGHQHWAATGTAVKALRPLLRGQVEILPLKVVADYEEDEDYDFDELPARPKLRERYPSLFALHPLDSVAVGPSAKVEYFLDNRDIIWNIERYAFRPADLEGRHFFRVRGAMELYLASEEFRQAVQRHKLRGLDFQPINYVADDAEEPARRGRAEKARTGTGRRRTRRR